MALINFSFMAKKKLSFRFIRNTTSKQEIKIVGSGVYL